MPASHSWCLTFRRAESAAAGRCLHRGRAVGAGRYGPAVAYFLALGADERNVFGRPEPAAGVRVVFEPELLFAARGEAAERRLIGDEGLVVYEDPRAVLAWPCRLWEVEDPDGAVARGNGWFRSRAVTVVREVPSWLVFGERGAGVARVVEEAGRLTDGQARSVAAEVDPSWELPRFVVGHAEIRPLGGAVWQVHDAVVRAARAVSDDLFAYDEEDEVDYLADPEWQRARSAGWGAAIAAGTADAGTTAGTAAGTTAGAADGAADSGADVRKLAELWERVVGSGDPGSGRLPV